LHEAYISATLKQVRDMGISMPRALAEKAIISTPIQRKKRKRH